MSKRRFSKRTITIVTGILFAVVVAVWIWSYPFRAVTVMRVLPANTTWASLHERPGKRWLTFLSGPVMQPVLDALNADITEANALIGLLGRRLVVAGYAPVMGRLGLEPQWTIGAWVGGWVTHAARWGLLDSFFEGFRLQRTEQGFRIWTRFYPDLPPPSQYLSFGFHEGVGVATLGGDPLACMAALRRLQRQADMPAGEVFEQESLWIGRSPDRFFAYLPGDAVYAPLTGSIDLDTPGRLQGRLTLPQGLVCDLTVDKADARMLLAELGDAPDALLLLTMGDIERIVRGVPLRESASVAWLRMLANDRERDVPVVCWLSSGMYGGRIMRLSVPGVGVAFPLPEGVGFESWVHQLLDAFNQFYGLQLAAVPAASLGETRMMVITDRSGSGYAKLAARERAGIALVDDMVFLHSSSEALRRLLQVERRGEGDSRLVVPQEVTGYLGGDLESLSSIISKLLATYRLYSMFTGDSPLADDVLTTIRHFSSVLGAYDEFTLELKGGESPPVMSWGVSVRSEEGRDETP